MSTLVRVSEIGLYLRCPRLIYFENLKRTPKKINAGQILLHSLMLSISQKDDLERQLKESLARLEDELPLVYEIEPGEMEPACRELEGEIAGIAQGLAGQLDLLLPCQAEVDLYSGKLGLSGRLDRLAPGGTPSLIRTGKAPEDGIWKRDRLMLAGYALLLGEKQRTHINQGLVEYPRQGLVRAAEIHSVDRARVLRIRDRIKQIKEGQLPDRPEDAPCPACEAREICETRHSLASRFF
ncbi:MAG: PD-(D/E)XK nuclease family protein [Methanothrix sp.]|jgi:CRISPR-associated exonuclease Cas4|nr:PD-(D/E)XK nuclease family protein [Methanothrix sp.]